MSPFRLSVLSVVVTGILTISGCSSETSEEQLKQAQQAIEQGEYKKAELIAKNVLLDSGTSSAASLQLGTAYYFQGEFESALKEFEKLKNADDIDGTTVRYWLQSLLFTDSLQQINNVLSSHESKLPKDLAYYYAGKAGREAGISDSTPDSKGFFKVAECISAAKRGATTTVDCIESAKDGDDNEYFYELATYSMYEGRHEVFLSAVATLAGAFPQSAMFQILNADALVRNKQFEKAESKITPLLKKYPDQGFLNYLRSVVSFEKQDFESSKSFAEKAIQNGVDNARARLIAAISAYNLEAFEQAYNHFESIAGVLSKDSPEYRIYSSTLLALGYKEKAISVLEEMNNVSLSDLPLYTSAAKALSSTNKSDEALSVLKRFDNLVDGETDTFVELNINKLALDDLNALANLESLDEVRSSDSVKTALASFYLSRNEFNKAAKVADDLAQSEGGLYTSKVIEALIALKQGAPDVSERFSLLFEFDENSLPALFYFIDENIKTKQYKQALAFSERLQKQIPGSVLAVTTHIKVLSSMQRDEELIAFLKRTYQEDERNVNIASLYASELFNQGHASEANRVLSNFSVDSAAIPIFWLTLIKAESVLGNNEAAKKLAKKWVSIVPDYKPAVLLASNLLEADGDYSESIRVLRKAQLAFPSDSDIRLLIASNLLSIDDIRGAKKIISSSPSLSKSGLPYNLLAGRLALADEKFDEAQKNLELYFNEYKTYDSLMLLLQAYRGQKAIVKATEACEDYINANGVDPRVSLYAAELYIKTDHNKAIMHYERLLRNGADSAMVLNNLAWLHHVNSRNDRALEYAERAVKIEGENPDYLDTLGMIQLRMGSVADAESILNKAHSLASTNLTILLHYAEALVLSGKVKRAENLLSSFTGRSSELDQEIKRILESKRG